MAQPAKLITLTVNEGAIVYPDTDGEPMAENTKQYQYIVTIQGELDALFAADPKVFVAADLFWYPVQGRTDIVYAPDTMVVFGRPKGHRLSYRQWEEDGIAPQVVFEIISPSNSWLKMEEKREFYQQYGVEEYYEYDPDTGKLRIWLCEGGALKPLAFVGAWRSRLLGVTLKLEADGALSLYRPDGRKFLSPVEQEARARQAEAQARQAAAFAEREHERAAQVIQENERLAAKLRELGIDPATLT
ncbi:MAG: Uma2 family endonuclease [Acidobacteria bacterium]|nr:Uma2 family endonuclease [Acidobacteriota bacterium]MBI3425934.1 Uma2 family endonuclease [Acidobacteriota bacterium]